MRELGGYHGEHRRHGRHASDAPHGRDGTLDAHAGRAPDAHARNSSERAAQDALKLKMATDPEARKAAFLKNQRSVNATNAEYAARHAKPRPADQDRAPERREPLERKAEHAAHDREISDALAEVDDRSLPRPAQADDVSAKEKPRLINKQITYWAAVAGYAITTTAEHLNLISGTLAKDIAGGLVLLAAGMVLRREKHGKD